MRFVNLWIFFYDLLLYYVLEKRGGGGQNLYVDWRIRFRILTRKNASYTVIF